MSMETKPKRIFIREVKLLKPLGHVYSYGSIHLWLCKSYQKSKICDFCGTTDPERRYEWALRKGFEHALNIDNYFELCASCHKKYDMTDEQKLAISKKKKGMPCTWFWVPVICKKDGVAIRFPSVKAATIKTGVKNTNISNVLSGRAKTAGGYTWKYA